MAAKLVLLKLPKAETWVLQRLCWLVRRAQHEYLLQHVLGPNVGQTISWNFCMIWMKYTNAFYLNSPNFMIVTLEGGWNQRLILMEPSSEKLHISLRQRKPHRWVAASFSSSWRCFGWQSKTHIQLMDWHDVYCTGNIGLTGKSDLIKEISPSLVM